MNSLKNAWKSLGVGRTAVSLSIARMADAIGNSLLFVIIPLYVSALPNHLVHFPKVLMIGILLSSYGLANAILQPFAGAISDRIGHHKRFIQAGLILIALATLGFAFANRYLDLLGLRIAQGLGLALEIPPTMALLAIVTHQSTRGGAMGFYTTMRMLGLTIGPLVGGYLHDHYGFNTVFYVGAGILFAATLIVQFGVVHLKQENDSASKHSGIIDMSLISPGIAASAVATFLMASAFTLVTTLENEFNSRLNINAFGFSIAFSALMVGRLLFQVPLGHWSDKRGRKPFVLIGLIFMAVTTALLGEVQSLFQFAGLRFLQGIAAAAIVAPALAYAGDIAQRDSRGKQGQQMSIVTMGFGLGIAFGPLLAGVLSIVFFELAFWVDGFLCLVGSLVVYLFMSETVQIPKNR